MPRYDFACQTCGARFERDLPIGADQSAMRCPHGHKKIQRVYSAPAVVFRGSGFYATDHRPAAPSGESPA